MEKNEEVQALFEKIILHLARPENRETTFFKKDIFTRFEVPQELAYSVFRKLTQEKFVDMKADINNPQIKINQKGLKISNEILEKIYMETSKNPFFDSINIPLKDCCELIFQKHQEDGGSIFWTKDTFNPYPNNLITAKAMLLKEGIIFKPSERAIETILNPEVLEAKTYDEARRILKGEKFSDKKESNNTFSQQDVETINSKLDEIIKSCAKSEAGQEIIFEELQELKELYFLKKSTWSQLLRSKLVDLFAAEVISGNTARNIYKIVTDSFEVGRLILPS